MRRFLLCAALAALSLPAVAGAGGSPNVTVKVRAVSGTEREIVITNHDSTSFGDFIVKATDSPKITFASRPCTLAHDTFTSQGKKHTEYVARCKRALAPGKKLVIRIDTAGRGPVDVFVSVNGVFTRVGQG